MKRKLLAVAAVMALSAIAPLKGAAQESRYTDSYVEVNGNAEREVAPDRFYLRVDIDEQDSKGRKTLEQQQKDMLAALRTLGIDIEKQVTRQSLSSSYYNRKKNMATASYQLKLTSAEQLAKVWSALDELGFSGVSFQKAECSTIDKVREEVRQQAVRNARQQAESMAEAIDQSVGKCFYLNGGYSGGSAVYAQPRRMAKSVMADSINMIEDECEALEFDNIKVSASVTARFILE